MKEKRNAKARLTPAQSSAAVEETINLYHAWLAVLLQRLEQQEVRVGAQELKDAIGKLKCRVGKEGATYVISMGDGEPPKEDDHADQA